MKQSVFVTLLFAAVLSGCMAISPEDAADVAVSAKGILALPTTTQALAARVEVLEEQSRLTYGLVGALAAKEGVTSTDARDWVAEQDPEPEEEEEAPADEENPDAIDFASLEWKYGGVDGSRAKLDVPCIEALRVSGNTISWKWTTGLSSWGLAHTQADALACLFVERSDGTIAGGKFEWASTSRKSRGLKNILTGYGGWKLDDVPNPARVYLVILDKPAKRRSNIISAEWKR